MSVITAHHVSEKQTRTFCNNVLEVCELLEIKSTAVKLSHYTLVNNNINSTAESA